MQSPNPSSPTLARAIKAEAHRLGFAACRIATIGDAPHAEFFEAWLARGNAGEMEYLARQPALRRSPVLLGAPGTPPLRSLLALTVDYHQFELSPEVLVDPGRGIIARYAWGDDYHDLIRPLLFALDAFIRARTGRQTLGKCLVDTGPVLERDWAQAAGVGFAGKNCCTIAPGEGSWLLLATVLVPELLPPDPPLRVEHMPSVTTDAVLQGLPPASDYGLWRMPGGEPAAGKELRLERAATCGRCTRCLDGCPTAAFVGPYHLDPRRCIAYWTIEARGSIPHSLRSRFGNRIFGCDICQEVCPYNQRLPARPPALVGLQAVTDRIAPPLLDGFSSEHPYWLAEEAFRVHFRRSPVKRAKRQGMLRNVCVALGNWGAPESVEALVLALHDPQPLPRAHAAWALGRVWVLHGELRAQAALEAALADEADAEVQLEMRLALRGEA